MTTSGKMVRIFAEALVLSEAHVAARYRALRENGYVSIGARGSNAPMMTTLDGSRLLIALMGLGTIAQTPTLVGLMGPADCVTVVGDDELANALKDLSFEQSIARIFEICHDHRKGRAQAFVDLVRGLVVGLSPSELTGFIRRGEFVATFAPSPHHETGPTVTKAQLSSMRELLRSREQTGLRTQASVEAPELLELAPAFGRADALYGATH